jgi:hypothetical protein
MKRHWFKPASNNGTPGDLDERCFSWCAIIRKLQQCTGCTLAGPRPPWPLDERIAGQGMTASPIAEGASRPLLSAFVLFEWLSSGVTCAARESPACFRADHV